MTRPLILDLYCGAGGAGVGYHRAGWDVVGVDINPQPSYPFTFYQSDALEFLRDYGLHFDAAHASPPCQHYTALAMGTNDNQDDYPDLIPPTRDLLIASGMPYVIENVPPAPLHNPITLCGEMFGLGVIRHRKFESNMLLLQPSHPRHRGRVAGWRHGAKSEGPYLAVYGRGGDKGNVSQRQTAMGIDWMTGLDELAESIPPAYTELIGAQLLGVMAA